MVVDPLSFYQFLEKQSIGFYAGVPDSLLQHLCACIADRVDSSRHVIAANEGAAVALAMGSYLATGKIGFVYMQNSGLGNATNPLLSLVDPEVCAIPMLLMVGWRGEPGVKDEPQHVKQGDVTQASLEAMGIPYAILDSDTEAAKSTAASLIDQAYQTKSPVALVVRKGTFASYTAKTISSVPAELALGREEALSIILANTSQEDVVVSTTGMISREVFEIRESRGQRHERDFLTVGGMGHASQIALGIAMSKPNIRVVCLDGDGALIMHMGSLAIVGQCRKNNFVHIVLNNGRHDSVGGQPTVAFDIDIPAIAKACGYEECISVSDPVELQNVLDQSMYDDKLCLIEVRVKSGARADLGRPTMTPRTNKNALMDSLNQS